MTYDPQSVPEGALRELHLHLCYHLKEVWIVALPFYLYNMILECVAINCENGTHGVVEKSNVM